MNSDPSTLLEHFAAFDPASLASLWAGISALGLGAALFVGWMLVHC